MYVIIHFDKNVNLIILNFVIGKKHINIFKALLLVLIYCSNFDYSIIHNSEI